MKRQGILKKGLWLAGCIILPLLVGGIAAALTVNMGEAYAQMELPPLAPGNWVFPIVWTILYILMGVASYLMLQHWRRSNGETEDEARMTLVIYGVQLAFNFFWSLVFFNLRWYWFAAIWLLLMWAMIVVLVRRTRAFSQPATWMLIPYLVWTTYAAYLNLGVAILN